MFEVPEEPMSSGEFARRTRLSMKALRLYDRLGLLRPAVVDAQPDTVPITPASSSRSVWCIAPRRAAPPESLSPAANRTRC